MELREHIGRLKDEDKNTWAGEHVRACKQLTAIKVVAGS